LLTQAPTPLPDDGDDIVASTRAAIAAGFTPFHVPEQPDALVAALADLPARPGERAVWIGTIPEERTYRAVHAALQARGIALNDPEQHWPYFHDFVRLSPAEEAAVLDLARAAAARLDTPFLSLDIAQREDGRWIVIEPGDPQ